MSLAISRNTINGKCDELLGHRSQHRYPRVYVYGLVLDGKACAKLGHTCAILPSRIYKYLNCEHKDQEKHQIHLCY